MTVKGKITTDRKVEVVFDKGEENIAVEYWDFVTGLLGPALKPASTPTGSQSVSSPAASMCPKHPKRKLFQNADGTKSHTWEYEGKKYVCNGVEVKSS